MLGKSKQTYMALVFSAFAGLAAAGCQKIEPSPGPLIDAIPAEYGKLVGITQHGTPYVVVLWFEQPDGTLVAVNVNVSHGQIAAGAVKFPRK